LPSPFLDISADGIYLFGFQVCLPPSRFAFSLLLSFHVSPILFYLVSKWFYLNVVLVVIALFELAFFIFIICEKPIFAARVFWRFIGGDGFSRVLSGRLAMGE